MGLKKLTLTLLKKADPFEKTNYRPISILPILLKASESCLYYQIYEFTDNMLSKVQYGFRSNYDWKMEKKCG